MNNKVRGISPSSGFCGEVICGDGEGRQFAKSLPGWMDGSMDGVGADVSASDDNVAEEEKAFSFSFQQSVDRNATMPMMNMSSA